MNQYPPFIWKKTKQEHGNKQKNAPRKEDGKWDEYEEESEKKRQSEKEDYENRVPSNQEIISFKGIFPPKGWKKTNDQTD